MLTYFKITSINIFKIHLDSANLQVLFDISCLIYRLLFLKGINIGINKEF